MRHELQYDARGLGGSKVARPEGLRLSVSLSTLAHMSRPRPFGPVSTCFAVILAVGLAAVLLRPELNPFAKDEDLAGRTVLESLTDVNEFHAVNGYYETVVLLDDASDSLLPDFLAGDRVVYVGKGSVDVVVDFSDLDAGAITTSADRTAATLELPKPTLGTPSLDLEKSSIFSHDQGIITKFKGSDLERKAQLKAVEQITEAASHEDALVERAETNTTLMLQELLGGLGYDDVDVAWIEDPAA